MLHEQNQKRNIAVSALALLLALLCACGARPTAPETTQETPDIVEASVAPTPPPASTPVSTPASTPSSSPTPAPTPTPVPVATPEPRAERVEDDYFADAAFFGNSLVDGLHSFGGLDQASFFAGTSASVISVESIKDKRLSDGSHGTMLDALLEEDHGKIYVLLGVNELGFNVDSFVEMYGDLLDKIRDDQPQAQIYVMSLTPITKGRSSYDTLFNQERVQIFNEAIQAMAEEEGYIYLDLFDALSDDEGFLPEERSTDGVHFTVDTYLDWAEYLHQNYDGEADVTFYKAPVSEDADENAD